MRYDQFQNYISRWYQLYGRHDLPWRLTDDPYAILVSELMLQQTQVERVMPKYLAFLKQYPDIKTLSRAELAEVLIAWQGLGYNRRARYLHLAAQKISQTDFPKSHIELEKLPGIGPYTATAICAFSYNQPVKMIETNIRSVFLYHFFPNRTSVSDRDLLPLIKASLDKGNPREWYWALMDYGSYLKKILPNPNRRSQQYNKQSPFQGSRRQVRSEILRVLSTTPTMTNTDLQQQLTSNRDYFQPALRSLLADRLIHEQAGVYQLAKDNK